MAEEVEAAFALRFRLRLERCSILLGSLVLGAEPAPVLPGLGFGLELGVGPDLSFGLGLAGEMEETESAPAGCRRLGLGAWLRLFFFGRLRCLTYAGAEPAPALSRLSIGSELRCGPGFGRDLDLRGGRCLCEPFALPARVSRMPFAAVFERELRLDHASLLGRRLGFLRLCRPNGAATEQAPVSRCLDLRLGRGRFLFDRFAARDEWFGCLCRGILADGRGRGDLDRALERRVGFGLACLDLRPVRLGLGLDRGQRPARFGLGYCLVLRLGLDLRDHLDELALLDTPDERLDILERRLRLPGKIPGERERQSGRCGRE